jgi:hypothetical protein
MLTLSIGLTLAPPSGAAVLPTGSGMNGLGGHPDAPIGRSVSELAICQQAAAGTPIPSSLQEPCRLRPG